MIKEEKNCPSSSITWPISINKNIPQRKTKWLSSNLLLTFTVLFTNPNSRDCVRIYHQEQLVDEIVCDSHVKKIHVPIRYQSDIQFLMLSENNDNACEFYFVTVTTPASEHRSFNDKMQHFFYSLSSQTKHIVPQHDSELYKIYENFFVPLFGMQICDQVARPNKQRVYWQSNIKIVEGSNKHHWHDEVSGETFVKLSFLSIAEFRPGHMCFIRRPISGSYHINVFQDINIDFDQNLCHLIKSTGKTLTIPSSHMVKFENISTPKQYLDFIGNCLMIWPMLVASWRWELQGTKSDSKFTLNQSPAGTK